MAKKRKQKKRGEAVFRGLGVSPGIGIGVVHLHQTDAVTVPEYRIPQTGIAAERERFAKATAAARRQIGRLRAKAKGMSNSAAGELDFLLDAYQQMLKNSRLVRGVDQRIVRDRINAEAAVQAEVAEIAEAFAAMDDAYLAARLDDIREVGRRLIGNLTKTVRKIPSRMPRDSIVVAQEMTPADTALLDPGRAAGITAEVGGAEGHTAIMARALGLPAVLAVPGLLKGARAGDSIVIDGDAGQVVVNPSPATLAVFQRLRSEKQREKRQLSRLKRQPAITLDGVEVTLLANVELPIEMALVNQAGAAGIGLLRSEFMFMNREDLPGEEEQFQVLRTMVEPMEGKPVTIRTLDVGGEKISGAVMGDFRESASSALGLRGIRLSLARDELLEIQFRACLRVSAFGNVRILLPMVTTVAEVRQARAILARAARRLKRRGAAMASALPLLGVMIEVPGAALAADALAQACDFFAIGSNDLTMYTLAVDRGDDQVAHLYNPLHPAILRLIQFATAAALRARIPVSVCGEIAGDPRFLALLLGLGLREFSMTPSNIPRVKKRILALDSIAAAARAGVIMDQMDAGRIAMLLDDFNALA